MDNFEKKNPTLFAKFYSPNFENPQLFKTQQELMNRIEEPSLSLRSPCFTPTFMRSSTPMKSLAYGGKAVPFKPPSIPSRPASTSSQISESLGNSIRNNERQTPEIDNDVQFVSEFHPQKVSTQSQRRFQPYKPAHSTGRDMVKTETEPQTVAEIICSQAISQGTPSSPASILKVEPDDDVQLSFEFHPQKMSTQLPQVLRKNYSLSRNIF